MSAIRKESSPRVTVPGLQAMKAEGRRIAAMTAYDMPTAAVADAAGIDLILVGDSLGMVVLGETTTLRVTLDDMIHHSRAVSRGANRALLVGDMPWLTYHTTAQEAVKNAGRFIQEGGMSAVKLEGGRKRLEMVKALLDAEIPVLGHIGLTPQSVNVFGGFKVQGRTASAAEVLLDDARALESAGAFALVLESMPSDLAAEITRAVAIPTIGIGAGAACDGQILVFHDCLGWHAPETRVPRFVRSFANLWDESRRGLEAYAAAVRDGSFPAERETYGEREAKS